VQVIVDALRVVLRKAFLVSQGLVRHLAIDVIHVPHTKFVLVSPLFAADVIDALHAFLISQ
jgi:hypothetical protein